ncbi:butyrophilin subfamily 3 member A2-like [Carettochelys insculpta]|uniref:butyrophilin subfamily 3 member A2-like n=1 Tax=Carettochelys insculpta TaxID=44489 RepID=UPI003EB6ED81
MATQWLLYVCSLGILLAPCSLSVTFSLVGSSQPMVGVVGQDVVLPCQLSPASRLPRMDVIWRKIVTPLITVHEYSDENVKDQAGQGYWDRAELFPQEFRSGNVSLKLKQLQVADAGKYQCLVRSPDWSQEANAELQVLAVAPVFIDVLGPREQGIGLTCRSTGWFPKPQVQWVGKKSQSLKSVISVTQDGKNLYNVESHVTVTEGEDHGDISCVVWNDQVKTERQSAIHLSDDVFPHASPWRAAFWVLFTLVLIAAGACAYVGYTAKRKVSQKKKLKGEALELLETKEKTWESECLELHQRLEAERKAFDTECQRLREIIESHEKKEEEEEKQKEEEKKKKEEEKPKKEEEKKKEEEEEKKKEEKKKKNEKEKKK